MQAACERALAAEDRFVPGTRFDAWMFRILRNLWIDHVRRAKTAGPAVDIDATRDIVGSSGERDADARLTLKSVTAAIDELPDEQREVLLLDTAPSGQAAKAGDATMKLVSSFRDEAGTL